MHPLHRTIRTTSMKSAFRNFDANFVQLALNLAVLFFLVQVTFSPSSWPNDSLNQEQQSKSFSKPLQRSELSVDTQNESLSHFDYNIGSGLQSTPLGAAAYADIGYSQLLWGKKQPGGFQYGYLRPATKLQTSVLVNRAEFYVDFYPISIFGISAGTSITARNTDLYTGVNCTTTECKGVLSRQWIKTKLTLGYTNFYFVGSVKFENLKHSSQNSFVDDMNILISQPKGDQTAILDITLGYQWSDRILTGIHRSTVKTNRSHQQNQLLDFYTAYQSQGWKYLGGVGLYQSTITPLSPTAYFLVQWLGKPSLALK